MRQPGSTSDRAPSRWSLKGMMTRIPPWRNGGNDGGSSKKTRAEALLKAGDLKSAIFNSANFSSIATDAEGVIQIFNVGAERMLGYAAADVTNEITPADISDPQELIRRAEALSLEFDTPIAPGFEALVFKASRGIEDIYELTYIREDGSRFPALVSVTALRDEKDAVIGYLLIGTDNTARQRVEEERMKLDQRLRDQHFYTRSLIESNIDALMTTDPRGIITDVNKQTETLTGRTRDELIGAPFKSCFTDPERAEAGINRVLVEGEVRDYELTARALDGTLTDVSFNASTFHDRDRRLQGVFASARDMTDLKRYERRLQRTNAELEEASRMKSEFLANMSHELRTPLSAIIGFSELMKDGLVGTLSEQQERFVFDIFNSGQHLLALINDILDLSKVEAGKMELDLEPVPVATLVENSLTIIREKAAKRNVRLELDADPEVGTIRLDPRKVNQILYNLLSNAVKFSNDGGRVVLRTHRVGAEDVGRRVSPWAGRSFATEDSDFPEFLRITVSDEGVGISEEAMHHLFQPFTQVDSGLGRKFEGTGLGLAMVKLLAELHGGGVAMESASGQGSIFTVWLPMRAPDTESTPVTESTQSSGSTQGSESTRARPAGSASVDVVADTRRTALIVEGDLKSADLIRLQLEGEGFTVLHAFTAEEALLLARQQPPTLITLDILLPRMDGWEFLSLLRETPELSRIPVVIVSIAADAAKGFSLGAAAVMEKPVSHKELGDALADLGMVPLPGGESLSILIVDDDPVSIDLMAEGVRGLAGPVLRASGGHEAIEIARRELPDAIILDLLMPDGNGFDVVVALQEWPDTALIPIIIVTALQVNGEDRATLNGYVAAIMEKGDVRPGQLSDEIRRAMAGREQVV